jgi:hypothetical protein
MLLEERPWNLLHGFPQKNVQIPANIPTAQQYYK